MEPEYAIGDDLGPMPDILLVEDNPLHVRLVKSMLADIWDDADGLRFAKRLDSAIEMVQTKEPACILLDLVLPDAQDLEAVKAMLAVAPNVPIVVLSAHEDDELAMHAVSEGAQDYLVKGTIGADQLARSIHFAMQRHQMDRPEADDEPVVPMAVSSAQEATAPVPPPAADAAGIAVMARNGSIIFAEPAVADQFGLRVADLVGMPITDLSYPSDVEAWNQFIARNAGGELDLHFRHSSGTSLRMRLELTPLEDGSDEVAAYVARYYPTGDVGTAASGAYTVITEWTSM